MDKRAGTGGRPAAAGAWGGMPVGKGVSSGGHESALELIVVVGTPLNTLKTTVCFEQATAWYANRISSKLRLLRKRMLSTPCRAATRPGVGGGRFPLCGGIGMIGHTAGSGQCRCPPGRWDGRRGAGGGDLSDSRWPSRRDSKPRTPVGGLALLTLPRGRPPSMRAVSLGRGYGHVFRGTGRRGEAGD